MCAEIGLSGEFLKLKETRTLFRTEQHFPSSVIERGDGSATFSTAFERACARVEELLNLYIAPSASQLEALQEVASREADRVGLKTLPGVGSELDSIHAI